MTESPRITPSRRGQQAARKERLARALRDNLRRRKEQARAREGTVAEPTDRELPAHKPPA